MDLHEGRHPARGTGKKQASRTLLARFLLFVTAVIWGWTFVATKVCLAYMSPIELMGLRFLIALPVLLALVLLRGISLRFPGHRRGLLLGAAVFAAHFFLQITALKYTTATNTGWIIAVTPLVIALLAFLILREPIGRNTVIGIGVATAGIVLLVSKGSFGELGWLSSVGDWLVLVTAHTWALYTIATRDVSRAHDPLAVIFAVCVPAAALALGVMFFEADWGKLAVLPLDAVVALVFLGVLGTALAHWFWQVGLSRVGAAEAGAFIYLEPVATTALAVPYLGESFGGFAAAGGVLVLAGVWMAQKGSSSRRAPPSSRPGKGEAG